MVATTLSLLPASFKGVPFLMDASDLTSGRKTVTFEYPNQDTRYVEDLGLLPPIFKINAVIAAVDYPFGRDRLIQVLQQPGAGLLVHPIYGNITVTSTQFTLNESMTSYGRANFSITFESSSSINQPSLSSNILPLIGNLAVAVQAIMNTNFNDSYSLSSNNRYNYNDSVAKALSFSSLLSANIKTFTGDPDVINELNSEIQTYNEQVSTNVIDPALLSSSTATLLNNYSEAPDQEYVTFSANVLLFNFGSNDSTIDPITQSRAERLLNRSIFNDLINVYALSNAMASAALLNYQSQNQLTNVETFLEAQYQNVIQSNSLGTGVIQALRSLHTQVRIFFNNLAISLPMIETVNTNPIPLTVLTYQYYGSVDNVSTLFNLNSLFNPLKVYGSFEILSS